jgi:hypothetical protein
MARAKKKGKEKAMSEFWKAFRSPQEKLDDELWYLHLDCACPGVPECRFCQAENEKEEEDNGNRS